MGLGLGSSAQDRKKKKKQKGSQMEILDPKNTTVGAENLGWV
jgi:hypothetical protein